MRLNHLTLALLAATVSATAAQAGSQSSNTSSNSSSNNGVVRERVVDTYCEDGRCDRSVVRSTYRDDKNASARQKDDQGRSDHGRDHRHDDDD